VIDCNKWKTEKRQECANMEKVKRLQLLWQLYRTSIPVRDLENFRPMDIFWTECTSATDTSAMEKPCIAFELTNCVCKRKCLHSSSWADRRASCIRKVSKATPLLHTYYTTTWETDRHMSSWAEDFLITREK